MGASGEQSTNSAKRSRYEAVSIFPVGAFPLVGLSPARSTRSRARSPQASAWSSRSASGATVRFGACEHIVDIARCRPQVIEDPQVVTVATADDGVARLPGGH